MTRTDVLVTGRRKARSGSGEGADQRLVGLRRKHLDWLGSILGCRPGKPGCATCTPRRTTPRGKAEPGSYKDFPKSKTREQPNNEANNYFDHHRNL